MCVFPSVHLITTILGRQSPHNHVFHSAPIPPLNYCIRVGAPTLCHHTAVPPHSSQTSSWLRWALTRRKKRERAAEIWQQLQTERRQERVVHVSSPLLRDSGNAGGLLVGEARAENERANGGVRRVCLIMKQSKDREAEITERLKWGSLIVEGIKGEGGSSHHHQDFFFFCFFITLDLKMNRWNKKLMHAQSSQSTLPGGIPCLQSKTHYS